MINKIIALLRLRLWQIWRTLRSVGWGLLTIFLLISIGFVFPFLHSVLNFPHLVTIPATLFLMVIFDFYRKDKLFLRSVFKDHISLSCYFSIEYIILTLPVWLYQFFNHPLTGCSILMISILTGFLSPVQIAREQTTSKKTIKFAPLTYFELKFFIERNSLIWFLFWAAGFSSIIHIGFYITWVFILLMTLPEIFRYYESRDMLHWKNGFVFDKIKKYTFIFMLIILPQSLSSIYTHPQNYLIVLYTIICIFSALVLNIVLKYASYTPIYHASGISNISGILTLIMLIPGGVLITIGYSIWKYIIAEKNIRLLYA